ncbi:unnamed protein product, partial [Ectocarpus sp. 8 AP-2014]
ETRISTNPSERDVSRHHNSVARTNRGHRWGVFRGSRLSMLEPPQQDVTSFKARTHHGSGQKETYDLKACVFLEDARPPNDRAIEVPREMRLSLLRWDRAEEGCQQEPPEGRGADAHEPRPLDA